MTRGITRNSVISGTSSLNVAEFYLVRVSSGILSQGMLSCKFRVYLRVKKFGQY